MGPLDLDLAVPDTEWGGATTRGDVGRTLHRPDLELPDMEWDDARVTTTEGDRLTGGTGMRSR